MGTQKLVCGARMQRKLMQAPFLFSFFFFLMAQQTDTRFCVVQDVSIHLFAPKKG